MDKFLKLFNINEAYRHLIDWGRSSASVVAFSSASELSSLKGGDQDVLVDQMLKYQLSKDEVKQIVQIRERSGSQVGKCIEDVLKLRPTIVKKNVFVGTIISKEVVTLLDQMTQAQRDELLKKTMTGILPLGTVWSGRLGKTRFSLVGGEIFSKQLLNMKPNFETHISNQLKKAI